MAAKRGGPIADIADREALTIKKLRHEQFGQSSEHGALLDQLELQLADLEENAAQADTAGADGRSRQITLTAFERRKTAHRPLPEHLPRERIVYSAPVTCHAAVTHRCPVHHRA